MAIVVSDTSPLRALHHLHLVHLLRDDFTDVITPPAVASELAAGTRLLASVDVTVYPFIRTVVPNRELLTDSDETDLDLGECEAIELALELRADKLLIDERAGRNVAARRGISTVGALGILPSAKQRGAIPAIVPLMDELRTGLGFFIDVGLYNRLRQSAGE